MGGPSSEHEVSLKSGRAVLAHIDTKKYDPLPLVISKLFRWSFPNGEDLDEYAAIEAMKKEGVQVVFNALHGAYGEDGTLQEALTRAGIPFTGSKAYASAFSMNKEASMRLFAEHGLTVPAFVTITRSWSITRVLQNLKKHGLVPPLILKPLNLGSSVGVRIVRDKQMLGTTIREALDHSHEVIIQRYIEGREITCGVIEKKGVGTMALPPTEVIPQTSEFFDYEAKYTPGASKEITPAKLPEKVISRIQETALATHRLIGCSGFSRTDMILSDSALPSSTAFEEERAGATSREKAIISQDSFMSGVHSGFGELYVLELNALPGLTETSLIPQQAAAAGISFTELVDILIETAMSKK